VIAVDLPGFGRSAALPDAIEPTIPAYADAFEWFIAELGLQRPHVAGNSMGGAIGLELARRRAVASVTAFSPAGFWTPGERAYCQASLSLLAGVPEALRPALRAGVRSALGRRLLLAQLFGYPARLPAEEAADSLESAWAAPALPTALAAFAAYDFVGGEDLDGAKVTVAWGNRDLLLPYRLQAPRAHAALPRARHLTLGAGHVPFYDDPGAVASSIELTAT
jgi:pimeloyl-ACP methyl ester carboxylesterase